MKLNSDKVTEFGLPEWFLQGLTILSETNLVSPINGVICGGQILRAMIGEEKADWDIYFHNRAGLRIAANRLGHMKAKDTGGPPVDEYFHVQSVAAIREYKSITLGKIQLIRMKFKLFQESTVELILNDFDFTCCQWACDGDKIYYTNAAWADSFKKVLNIHNPKCFSFDRVEKYRDRGFKLGNAYENIE